MKKIILLFLATAALAACGAEGPYHFLKVIPLSGEGGWDYLTVDSAAHRLYVSHATKMLVVDLSKDEVIGEITNTPGVHGIAIAPDLGRGLVTCGRENKAAIVDLKTLAVVSKVATGAGPDSMLYDPVTQEFYTFNGYDRSATVIDAKSGKVIATVPLGGRPEFAVVDPVAGIVYDNLEDKSEVAVIDAKTHQVASRWPIAPGEEGSGLAIDLANHRLFIGCGGSQTMVMMDGADGKVLASVPIGAGVDANAFDPGTQFAFASCGDGTTTIAREEGEKLVPVQTLKTERSARTLALDPATHKIYLAAAGFDAPAAGQRRGRMIPGTFEILVYGMEK